MTCDSSIEVRRTKIVATLGPATRNPEIVSGLIAVGADVFRLNLSHGTRDEHEQLVAIVRGAATAPSAQVGLLADLPGPSCGSARSTAACSSCATARP